jgi:hypothetical protein
MNKQFADHVTNTAFFLSISKKQIQYLEHLVLHPYPSHEYYDRSHFCEGTRQSPDNWVGTLRSLASKGLVIWIDHGDGKGHYQPTHAGDLTYLLLGEAGLVKIKEDMRKVV